MIGEKMNIGESKRMFNFAVVFQKQVILWLTQMR